MCRLLVKYGKYCNDKKIVYTLKTTSLVVPTNAFLSVVFVGSSIDILDGTPRTLAREIPWTSHLLQACNFEPIDSFLLQINWH